MFNKKLGLEGAYNLNTLLTRAQPCINNEEELMVYRKGVRSKTPGKQTTKFERDNNHRRDE